MRYLLVTWGARDRYHFSAGPCAILHRTVVSPLLSSKASATCHPERRRREGSACSQRRRLGAATVEEGPLFSRAQPRLSSTRSATPGTRTGVSVSPRLAVRTSA